MRFVRRGGSRAAALLLAIALLCAALAGCKEQPQEPSARPQAQTAAPLLAEQIPPDNCRNWYEIYVYSFSDGDGDRIGDFKGLAQKLDYVRDMGFTGIWLMPIMPSPSYHKYDVTDFYSIDPDYGTLTDFQAFLTRAHELGIKVILDLVVNHTSNEHPWFIDAKSGLEAEYRDYYNFIDSPRAGYTALPDGSCYESRFVSSMPDLNLDNARVRDEIVSIMRFWLEMGVDGFRLDAVTSYYTGDQSKNVSFLSWLNQEAKEIRPDCFIVGEAWSDMYTVAGYYKSGLDSFFCFPTAGADGYVAKILGTDVQRKGESYGNVTMLLEETFPGDALMAPFLGNHDMDRITNAIGIYDMGRLKAATGMLAMMRGGLFYYYGDEIGMIGTGKDQNKRIGVLWNTLSEVTRCPPGTSEAKYALPSVAEQTDDPDSLLNYVKRAMNLRNAIPAIARGTSTVQASGDPALCVIHRSWEGTTVTIVLNIGAETKTVSVDTLDSGAKTLLGVLEAAGGVTCEGGTLTLSGYGIAVLG